MKLRGMNKLLLLLLAVSIYSCGKTPRYEQTAITESAVAGQYTKPKIDILVFQDKSSSMASPISYIKPQLDSFLNGINGSWDFRFIVLPLQSVKSATGKYIVAQDCSSVSVGTCLTPSQVSYFNSAGSDTGWITSIDSNIGSTDLGFQTMQSNINQSSISGASGFLRSDAALAVLLISNGEDVTNVTYWDPDGDGTSSINYNSSTSKASLNSFVNYLSTVKGGSSLLKFYPVVATASSPGTTTCYGSSAFVGYRYMQVAGALSSYSYNLCNASGLNTVLSNISSQISSMITSIIFNYVVITEDAKVDTIQIQKNGVTIPQSSSNGWSYEGYKTNAYTSYSPQLGNAKTGYFIKLNGSAVYSGSDKISITYKAK